MIEQYLKQLEDIAEKLRNQGNDEDKAIAAVIYTILGAQKMGTCVELLDYIEPFKHEMIRRINNSKAQMN